MESKKKYWFAPKIYGWGYMPVSWEGLAITALMVGILILWVSVTIGLEEPRPLLEWRRWLAFVVGVVVIASAPLVLCKKRMAGSLKWRWGMKDVDCE